MKFVLSNWIWIYLYNHVHVIFLIIFYIWSGDGVAEQLMSVAFQLNGLPVFIFIIVDKCIALVDCYVYAIIHVNSWHIVTYHKVYLATISFQIVPIWEIFTIHWNNTADCLKLYYCQSSNVECWKQTKIDTCLWHWKVSHLLHCIVCTYINI